MPVIAHGLPPVESVTLGEGLVFSRGQFLETAQPPTLPAAGRTNASPRRWILGSESQHSAQRALPGCLREGRFSVFEDHALRVAVSRGLLGSRPQTPVLATLTY